MIEKNKIALMEKSSSIIDRIKESFNKDGLSETQIIELYSNVDMLIIDDFGSENLSKWALEKLYKIISNRYDNELPIVKIAIDTVNNNTLYTTKAFETGTDARNILEYAMSDKASADRKTVVKRLKKGEYFDEAVKDFVSDSNFDTWYEATKAELEKLVK